MSKSKDGISDQHESTSSEKIVALETTNTGLPSDYIKINVPADDNCLFWSAALAKLLPTIPDQKNLNKFEEVYTLLFGKSGFIELVGENKKVEKIDINASSTREGVRQMLITYDCKKDTPLQFQGRSLETLICQIFRNRIVDHMDQSLDESKKESIAVESGKENWKEYSSKMRQPRAWGGEPEIGAISEITKTSIHVFGTDFSSKYLAEDSKETIYLSHVNAESKKSEIANHYQFYLPKEQWHYLKQ
jgi:OTU-like cysteine protease